MSIPQKVASRRLPPTFTSLYRLFLRTCSASVLHQKRSTRILRRLWRPTFDGAASAIHQLQDGNIDPVAQESLKSWLEVWNRRMDNTLSLLYTSSQSRGLPHKLTQNLSYMVSSYIEVVSKGRYEHWNSKLPPNDLAYDASVSTPAKLKESKAKEKVELRNALDRKGWGALGEVVKLAEGRDGIFLGRIMEKRKFRKSAPL